jgi:hypothetical protein
MSITTTDVVTNVVSGDEAQKTGTVVVCCQRTGTFNTIDPTYEKHVTYDDLGSLYTDRFDDVTYYTVGTSVIVGG